MTGTDFTGFTAEKFVEGIYEAVYDAAVRDSERLIADPPGGRPRPDLKELSDWWTGLGTSDRDMVRRAIRVASDLAVFGVLCVLDNVRSVSDGDVVFRLQATRDNEAGWVPEDETTELHDLFTAMVEERRAGSLRPTVA